MDTFTLPTTNLGKSTYITFSSPLGVTFFDSGFNSDLKVSSLYNTGHNKCKELLPTKLQFSLSFVSKNKNKNKNSILKWTRIQRGQDLGYCWMLFFTVKKEGRLAHP
jgi:hypothetical protein